ncbi:helix-turn-helix domain-containing protein [Candidatus Parvarchaeota archaeon]|nr:helix-turn-helix domain-containing protein [Candidatus Parvarchaeota archaeon]
MEGTERHRLILETLSVLEASGYQAFFSGLPGCFDIAGRKGQKTVLIKVLENIDAFPMQHAKSLESISNILGAIGIVVGAKSKEFALAQGVLYLRHGIVAISPLTMQQFLEGGEFNEKKFKKTLVKINQSLLVQARKSKNLTTSQLARACGLSHDTIYRYERSLTLASPKNAAIIEQFLGLPSKALLEKFTSSQKPINGLVRGAYGSTYDFYGFTSVNLDGPADMVGASFGKDARKQGLSSPKTAKGQISSIIAERDRDMRTLERRAEVFDQLSQIIGAHPCFFVKSCTKPRVKSIPVITKSELSGIRTKQQLMALIGGKTKN